jgi:hypothetical protein
VLEAQACGAKVITTNWTAQPELTGVGWSVEGQLEWDEFQGAFWKVPNVALIVEALEQAYAERDNEELKKAAVDFASAYATERVYNEHWKPIIARLEKSLNKQEPNRQSRRAAKRGK